MFKHLLPGLSIAALVLFTDNAAALCLPKYYYRCVGDHATDSNATDATIQLAIGNATCPNTVITITHEIPSALSSLALEINGKSNLTLVGAPSDATCAYTPPTCDPSVGCGGGGGTPPAPAATLHGNGAGSVIYIHGNSSVTLESLELTGGGGTDFGGGIHFTGTGSLTLVNTSIVYNSAAYGGGIQFNGSGGNATLTLNAGTIIEENTASANGGGIQVNGSARLFAVQPYTFIAFNHAASGEGGGIAVAGPAGASIGSPGYNGAPVLEFNDAAYGGGISVVAGQDNSLDAFAQVFTLDPSNPVQISNNTAYSLGGGLYTKAYISDGFGGASLATAYVYMCQFRMNNNIAPDGAAIYQNWDNATGYGDYGTLLYINQTSACGTDAQGSPIGVACAADVPCDEISGSAAENASSQPTGGAVVLIGSDSLFEAHRLAMRGNAAGYLVNVTGDNHDFFSVSLGNCLIANNHTEHELIGMRRAESTPLAIDSCTIAHNTIDNGYVVYANGSTTLTLTDTIVDMPGVATLDYTGSPANLAVSYVLSNDTGTLPVAVGIEQGAPDYVNAAAGDYHLLATSLGVDYAPANGGADLDGLPRDVDLAPVPNNYGPRDIGAYERQYVCTADTIYCNGFDTYQ